MTNGNLDMPRICNICHRVMFNYKVDYNHYQKNHANSSPDVEYNVLNYSRAKWTKRK